MLIRACLTADALFPTTGIAAQMEQDSQGGYLHHRFIGLCK